jgi:hypothetical protein
VNGFHLLEEIGEMFKVEILPPADFHVKSLAMGQNQTPLLGFMQFRQFSEIFW